MLKKLILSQCLKASRDNMHRDQRNIQWVEHLPCQSGFDMLHVFPLCNPGVLNTEPEVLSVVGEAQAHWPLQNGNILKPSPTPPTKQPIHC